MDLPLGFGKKLDVGTWSYGLLADFIQGGASSVVAGVSAIVYDPKDFNIQTIALYKFMLTVFAFNGVLRVMSHLAKEPLPPLRQTVTEEITPNKTKIVTVTETPPIKPDDPKL